MPPLLFLLACLAAGQARAACSSPTGNERDFIYNGDYHVYQFCNGTNWIAAGQVTPAVPGSLVGWWKFDDGSGTTAADATGNGSTGTLTDTGGQGLPTWNAVGKIGGDLRFGHDDAGGDNDVDVTSPAAVLRISGSLTVTAWINFTSVNANDADDHIFGREICGGNRSFLLVGTQDCSGVNLHDNLGLWLSKNGSTIAQVCASNTVFQTGTWYFVAAVYDSTKPSVHLYVNGIDDGETVYTGSLPTSLYNNSSQHISIGDDCGGSPVDFNGQIDDPRIYNRALSASEIAALYGTGCSSPTGAERDIIYNGASYTYQFCNGASWISLGRGNGGGGGGCSNPTGAERDIIYNGASHAYQFCNGTNWVAFNG